MQSEQPSYQSLLSVGCLKASLRFWLAAGFLILFSTGAPAAEATDDAIGSFDIERFEVSGTTLIDAPSAQQLVAPFAGRARSFSDVELAVEALRGAYRARGYSVVQVVVPEQELNQGVVRLQVIEARVGKVTIEGNAAFDEANIRRSVPALREGEIPNIARISSSLRVANENAGKKTSLSLQAAEREGEIDMTLQVTEEKPWAFNLLLANTGSERTGRTSVTGQYQNFNVAGLDHILSAQYTTSVERPDRVSVFGGSYRIPLYSLGDSVDFFGSYSEVDSGTISTGPFNLLVSGKGTTLGTRYNHSLPRHGDFTSKLTAGLDYKSFKDSVDLQGLQLGNDLTIRPASLAYSGELALPGSSSSFSITGVRNLPGGNKGQEADLQRVRSETSARYTLVRFTGSHLILMQNDWQARFALNGQMTRDALVPAEQFGAGGASTVRGLGERALSNDQGHAVNAELYTPELCAGGDSFLAAAQCRLLVFYDTGRVSRNRVLPGEQAQATIASAGIGLRLAAARQVSLQMDLGQVLDGADTQSRKGERRLHVSLSLAF